MQIIDLDEKQRDLFSLCLEDWSDEAAEGAPGRRRWVERFLQRGLRAKLATDDKGQLGGMIQYLPVEQSFVQGEDLYVILCIWVHGHKKGRGNFQGRGMGQALLAAAEQDARQLGARGMAAWGLWLPFWMKASWFRRQGYSKVQRQGLTVLLFKPFDDGARPPRWFGPRRKQPEVVPGKVAVTVCSESWCLVQNMVAERARRAARELGDRVVLQEIDISDRQVLAEWGQFDGLFIDGRQVRFGPPPSYEKIRGLIHRRLRRLG